MIFSSLFRPKHQDPKPQVRIKAISQLSADEPQQKSVLHELAFNDPDVNVSLAALTKLDSFVLWYKMAQSSKNDRIAKRAQQIIEQVLLSEQSDKITGQEKRTFIMECKDNKLLEKLLGQTWLHKESDLVLEVLAKLGKPQLTKQILFSSSDAELQLKLLDSVEDEATLNKVLKKVNSEELKLVASRKLEALQLSKQIPLELDKQTRLVLARLLALKERSDLPEIEGQRVVLVAQYEGLAKQFSYLTLSDKQNFIDKFADIEYKLSTLVAKLKPIWQAEQAAIKQQESIEHTSLNAQEVLQRISTELEDNIEQISEQQCERYAHELVTCQQQVQSLIAQLESGARLARRELENLNMQLLSCQNTLRRLPAFQQAIIHAGELLDTVKALPLPNDLSQLDAAKQYLHDTQGQWQELTEAFATHWPKSLTHSWQAQRGQWQQAIRGLRAQLAKDAERCRNKIRAVDALVEQGKFKVAMSLYQKVLTWYQALPEKEQTQLLRPFAKVQQQIENLKDWQDYIAAPRKPVLLKEAQDMVSQPLEIDQQAKKIKLLRQQWNSLGKLDNEADQALNKAFEDTIEQAFLPCRNFYLQQEQQREANLSTKQKLIASLDELSDQPLPEADLVKQVRMLQQQWQAVGEVDHKQRDILNQQYHAQLAPLKAQINRYYQDNAEQKQQLLSKAQGLLELESVTDAIEQAKKLQDKWKTIPHAGKKVEAQLWPIFRAANDQIFAKLKSQQQQEKLAVDSQIEQANSLLMTMAEHISQAHDKATLATALASQSELSALLDELPARARSALDKLLNHNLQAQQTKLIELQQNQQQQKYTNLFLALNEWDDEDTLPESVQGLPGAWQQCFKPILKAPVMDRRALTIVMEIIGAKESPKVDGAKRKDIQLQMMAEKLQHGKQRTTEELLKDWIQQGPLTTADKKLLTRVEVFFGA
ncbi:MAG: exonuclease SbcC [Paraglaciecola sp.]|jgi:exonuclease SbcC